MSFLLLVLFVSTFLVVPGKRGFYDQQEGEEEHGIQKGGEKVIRVTADKSVSVHPFPEGGYPERQRCFTGLIGNRCRLIEIVKPKRLYTEFGMDPDKVVMVVDEEGRCKDNWMNFLGSYLYGDLIMGDVLFMGLAYTEDGPDIAALPDDVKDDLLIKIRKFLKREKAPHIWQD